MTSAGLLEFWSITVLDISHHKFSMLSKERERIG
jgi:hypothetical protein